MTGPYYQQYPQQSPYPRQPPPVGPGGQSAIAVTTKFMWITWFFLLVRPKIVLIGQEVAGVWGRNVIPVPPGQHHLHIHLPYFYLLWPWRIGPADLTVLVRPGETVELEYRAPAWSLSAGSLGPPPQRYRGLGWTIAFTAGLLAIACSGMLIVVALAAG